MCSLFKPGTYSCVCCDTVLFDAGGKFESGTGWPSFTQPSAVNVIAYRVDESHGMTRVEALCNVVRRAPGPRVSGWTAAQRAALLHECGRAEKPASPLADRSTVGARRRSGARRRILASPSMPGSPERRSTMRHDNNPRNEMRPIKSGDSSRQRSVVARSRRMQFGKGRRPTAAKGPAAATVNGTAISQQTVDAIAKQGAASGRPDTPETRKAIIDQLAMQMVVAEEARQEGPGQDPRDCGTDRCGEAVGSGQRLRQGLRQEQSGHRRHGEGRIRPHQGDGHRQPVQGAPHPGGQGSRSQGHHREAQEGSRRLCEAGDGEVEGSGLQAHGRRSRMVRSERDGAGIRRRRDQAGKGQVHARSRSRRSTATT